MSPERAAQPGHDPVHQLLRQALGGWQTMVQVGISPDQVGIEGGGGAPLHLLATDGVCSYQIKLCDDTPPDFFAQWSPLLRIWRGGGMELDREAIVLESPVRKDLVKVLREMRQVGFRVPALPGHGCLLHRFDRDLVRLGRDGRGWPSYHCGACRGTFLHKGHSMLVPPWNRWLVLCKERLDVSTGGEGHLRTLREEAEVLSPDQIVHQWVLSICASRPFYDEVAARWASEPMLEDTVLGLAAATLRTLQEEI
jgi:hypothetical protein